MDKEEVTRQVEQYLNGRCLLEDIWKGFDSTYDSREAFLRNTIKRLARAFSLYHENSQYKNDYLMALRDYLICFDTTIALDNGDAIKHNTFGIVFDSDEKTFFATYSFPDGVNENFVRTAFLKENISNTTSSGANLAGAKFLAEQFPDKKIVTIICDFGERYLSTELFC